MVRKPRLYFELRSLSSVSPYRVRNRSRDTREVLSLRSRKGVKYLHLLNSPYLQFVIGTSSPSSVVAHVVEASLPLTPANGPSGRYSSATADARLDKNCHNFDSNSTPDAFVALE